MFNENIKSNVEGNNKDTHTHTHTYREPYVILGMSGVQETKDIRKITGLN